MKNVAEIMEQLNISLKAKDIEKKITFLVNETNIDFFLSKASGMKPEKIREVLLEIRIKRILNTRFEDKFDFILHYHNDRRETMERLFQEPICPVKMNYVADTKPDVIYSLHLKNPTVQFMNFVLELNY